MTTRSVAYLLIAVLVVVGTAFPAGAVTSASTVDVQEGTDTPTETESDDANASDDGVSTGVMLSSAIEVTSDDVFADFDDTAFEVEYENGENEERLRLAANRSTALNDSAQEILNEYINATAAFEAGEISREEYISRVGKLYNRAENLHESYEQLLDRLESSPDAALEDAGVNKTRLNATMTNLDEIRGVGPAALLKHLTGQSQGKLEITVANGIEIEAEGEDGEHSKEIRRPRDADYNITITQSEARASADAELSAYAWTLEDVKVDTEGGYYEFEYTGSQNGTVGELEVRVDGSTGKVFHVEEEIERLDDEADDEGEVEDDEREEEDDESDDDRPESDEDEAENEEGDGELAIDVVAGTPDSSATITIQVSNETGPVGGAMVIVDGNEIGTTAADGTIEVTLGAEESRIRVVFDEQEGETEFEFDAVEEDDESEPTETEDDDRDAAEEETEDDPDSDDDEPDDETESP